MFTVQRATTKTMVEVKGIKEGRQVWSLDLDPEIQELSVTLITSVWMVTPEFLGESWTLRSGVNQAGAEFSQVQESSEQRLENS